MGGERLMGKKKNIKAIEGEGGKFRVVKIRKFE